MITALLGLAVFPFAGIAIATYLLIAAGPEMTALAGALLVLAAGVFGIAMFVSIRLSRHEEWLWSQQDAINDLTERSGQAATRLAAIEEQGRQPALKLDEIMSDVRNLRDGFRGLIRDHDTPAARKPEPVNAAPQPAPQPVASRPAAQPPAKAAAEHLELLLEPVIELSTGSTAHYRALLDLTDDQGHVVTHAELMHKADLGGMRAALDAHLVKLVAPVLRRLRARNPGVRAFVPIGLSTLGSREETARIAAGLERDADVAGGIVFEFEHRDLGALDNTGIENLARLGRLGATMALSQVQVAALDLASLRQLGVRFLSFPPHVVDAGFGPSPASREFMQYARAMQFQIVVSGIVSPQQASAASKFARFGSGSFFAPPRKVRPDAGMTAVNRSVSAA